MDETANPYATAGAGRGRPINAERAAEEQMNSFIERSLAAASRPRPVRGSDEATPKITNQGQPEAEATPPASRVMSRSQKSKNAPLRMFAWKDGKVGTIILNSMSGFAELPP